MSDAANGERTEGADEGQVSETAVMSGGGSPDDVQPHDATAGDPSDESGRTQEGTAGPNAAPAENRDLSERESPAP